MNDYLVELGAQPLARRVVRRIGLPIPLPQRLKRSQAPWEERPLAELPVVVHHPTGAKLASVLAETLSRAGAEIWLSEDERHQKAYCFPGS